MKKYKLKSQVEHIKKFPALKKLIGEVTDGLKYPIEAIDTGEVGDMKTPILRLPNGNLVNLVFFEFEEIV